MTKEFTVIGSDWVTKIELDNDNDLGEDDLKIEAITRAVEGLYGKRDDVEIQSCDLYKFKTENEFRKSLTKVLTDEIHEGCRIGKLIGVIDCQTKKEYYIESKKILENVGMVGLLNKIIQKPV